MKINNLNKTNYQEKSYVPYYMMAVLLAVIVGYILMFLSKGVIIAGIYALKHWYIVLIFFAVLILLKRRGNKNRKEIDNGR